MKTLNYIFVSFLLIFTVACNNENQKVEQKAATIIDPKIELTNQINRLEGEMHRSVQIDNVTAGLALQAYSEYATNYPDDTLSPDYLFKSGEIATAIKQYPQALATYKKIVEKYPNYKLVQESLFLQASLLDNYLNEDIKAKIVYEQLISMYPNGSYSADAKAAINNLGKTDEQLIKEFQKKNAGK